MRFLILHGTDADHRSNWFPWLKQELENLGHEVLVPDLPKSDHPNIDRYWDHLRFLEWDFNNNVWIGHSSGSVAILGLLQKLPSDINVDTSILVGSFTKRLSQSPSWEMLKELFDKPFDFEKIKKKSKKFIFVHSKDDPICDISEARELHRNIGGDMIEFDHMGHFSLGTNPEFTKFPEILEIIKSKILP